MSENRSQEKNGSEKSESRPRNNNKKSDWVEIAAAILLAIAAVGSA